MRDPYYDKGPGRDRRRNHGREKQRRATAWLCVFALLLSALLIAVGFFPERSRKLAAVAGEQISALKERTSGIVPGTGSAETSALANADGGQSLPAGETFEQAALPEIEVTNAVLQKETEIPPETEAPTPITLSFAGDILFDDSYAIMATMLQRSGGTPDIETAFDPELLSLMRGADVFLVNNEFPYSKRGTPLPEKQFTFRADPAYASLLLEMGVDIAALANNHMYDHGEEALLDTLDTLQTLNIPYIGAGRNLEEASAPFYFTDGNIKIGFVCATQIERLGNPDTKGATENTAGVFRCLNYENLVRVIGEMEQECDFVVAYLHWGTESTEQIDEHQLKLAKAAVQAGADLIIGDHPHVLQKIDVVEGVPVVYSLGNFLFNSGAQDTCLITASIDPETAELISLQFIPARQEGCKTRLLTGSEQTRVIEYMRSISGVSIDDEGFVTLP